MREQCVSGLPGTGRQASPINFLIGGAAVTRPAPTTPTAVELLVDGQVVRSATGKDAEALNRAPGTSAISPERRRRSTSST
ncbi:hypothetical protein [Streptomyces capitiformicae]|uniref:Uncharacterized protein n=1 Tax=Streptomyces capitiformicae TaxID=2014920 RepID=A0A918ZFT4_9ACTN|nr:hypothetical protein [Streptomyces capitiformicae]GHE50260.1 hypothetical protein GCM10017771_72160 [Streptomyces capitiformicae]